MTKLDFDATCVYLGSANQKSSDFTELGHIAAGFPIAANPVVCMDQMRFNKVATKRIYSLGRKFVRSRIRC
jgi:hypothetical protein